MKTAALSTAMLAFCLSANADFSYTMTQKTTGGSMAAMAGSAGNLTSHRYLKGQKFLSVTGNTSVLIDFDAQTITTLNNAQKTYIVKSFSEAAAAPTPPGMDMQANVKETGQKKNINGFDASETIITMNTELATGSGPAIKMQIEMELWVSPDPPGTKDQTEFYRKNTANFPWKALVAGGNPSMQNAMEQIQRKMANMNGMVVEQVIRVEAATGTEVAQMPQMSAAQAAQMQAAMAKLREMAKQGGPGGAAAQQAMARMGNMGVAGANGGSVPDTASSAGSLIEMTGDANDFSNAVIPDSTFAIPADFKRAQ